MVLYIKAVGVLVVGIALLVERNSSALLDGTGRDGDYLLGTSIGQFIVAPFLFLVASAITSCAKWARLVTALVEGFARHRGCGVLDGHPRRWRVAGPLIRAHPRPENAQHISEPTCSGRGSGSMIGQL